MKIICRQCGAINDENKLDPRQSYMETKCGKCGAVQRIDVGATSHPFRYGRRDADLLTAMQDYPRAQEMPLPHETHQAEKRVPAHFIKRLIVSLLLFIFLAAVLLTVGFFFFIKGSDAYKVTEAFLRTRPEIRTIVGENITFQGVPRGSVEVSGRQGRAEISLSVRGTKSETDVTVYLKKEGGTWIVIGATYEDAGGKDRIFYRRQ